MKAPKIIFTCSECGYQSIKWLGKCPECGQCNTFVEEIVSKESKNNLRFSQKNVNLFLNFRVTLFIYCRDLHQRDWRRFA